MAQGLVDESVDSLTEGMILSGASEELQIRQGLRFCWSRQASREIHMQRPKKCRVSSAVRSTPKPCCDFSSNSWREKVVD